MIGLFVAFANQFEEQARDYLKTHENVRQRAVSGLLDPFQVLQPMRAMVESANACELQPPRPVERRRRVKAQDNEKRSERTAKKRSALNFA